jgi:peptide/nickel transport system substrate-binding protein
MEAVRVRRSPAEVRKMLADAGYRGEKLVVMHPTDQPFYDAITSVYVSQLRKVGLNIDEQSMDWGTIVQRRNSKEPLEKGGWSLFMSGFPAVDQGNPILASPLRTNGDKAWYGWPVNAKIESLREQWIDATDPAEQKRIAEEIQREAFSFVPYAPLGQYLQATAWRSNLSGLLRGPVPVFWNVQKA